MIPSEIIKSARFFACFAFFAANKTFRVISAATFRLKLLKHLQRILRGTRVPGNDQSSKSCIHPRKECAAPLLKSGKIVPTTRTSRPNDSGKSSQRLRQVIPTTRASCPNDSGKSSQRLCQLLAGSFARPFVEASETPDTQN